MRTNNSLWWFKPTKCAKADIDADLFNRKRPMEIVSCSNDSMFMAKLGCARRLRRLFHCRMFEEEFFSGVTDGFEWLVWSRLGRSDDVVPYSSCLHDRVFYQGASVRAL
ncbi:unnamed protein product [Angiostrongylus costaricensis]|uniref:Uncharacterized protein n=1 Tax=Angiostrongylus costaricensis TaxID=334426 RepID=A0A0R3PEI6_ANGCS|nr:unnamed protein product [Angiostrongylus costaricensis]